MFGRPGICSSGGGLRPETSVPAAWLEYDLYVRAVDALCTATQMLAVLVEDAESKTDGGWKCCATCLVRDEANKGLWWRVACKSRWYNSPAFVVLLSPRYAASQGCFLLWTMRGCDCSWAEIGTLPRPGFTLPDSLNDDGGQG